MSRISLLEAWSTWASGTDISDRLLWSISIQGWGRIGKFIQLLGGLTIVAEIVGPERLRSFGQSLHGAFTYKDLWRHFTSAVSLLWGQILVVFTLGFGAQKGMHRIMNSGLYRLNLVAASILGTLVACQEWSATPPTGWLGYVEDWIVISFGVLVLVSPFVVAGLIISLSLLGFLVDSLLLKPLAWLIERPQIDKIIKVASVLLLAVGFHFDLLAS